MHLVTSFLVLKPALSLYILMLVYSLIIYSQWSATWYGIFTRWRPPLPKEYAFPMCVSTSVQGWLNPFSIIQRFVIDFKWSCSLHICKQQRWLNEGAHGLCRFRTDSVENSEENNQMQIIKSRHVIHLNVHKHLLCEGPEIASEEQWKCL